MPKGFSEEMLAKLDPSVIEALANAEAAVKADKAAERKAKMLSSLPAEVVEAAQIVGAYLQSQEVKVSSSGWVGRDVRGIPTADGLGTIKVIYTQTRP